MGAFEIAIWGAFNILGYEILLVIFIHSFSEASAGNC